MVSSSMRYLALLIVLVGCGKPFDEQKTCEIQGLTFHLERSFAGDCEYYATVVDQAITVDSHFVQSMDKVLNGVDVWVHLDNGGIVCMGQATGEWGCYDNDTTIEVNVSGAALAHELLHRYYMQANVGTMKDNFAHRYWERLGSTDTTVYPAQTEVDGPVKSIHVGSWWDATEVVQLPRAMDFAATYGYFN